MQIIQFTANGAPVTGYLQSDHDRLAAHKTRPAVIICAGGAYRWLSPREKDPVALSFCATGYHAFLIEYSTGAAAGGLRPLRELAEAVRCVRANAAQWRVEPEHIAVLGFSAGGHLAASLGVLWDEPPLALGAASRPDALVLCYPVVTAGEFAHRESIDNVTGGDGALRELLSLEKHVGAGMPPTFLWHCVGDESVPVENALLLANAMRRAGVPFECHLFADGAHGISMCNREVETPDAACAAWVGLCKTWLNGRFRFVP